MAKRKQTYDVHTTIEGLNITIGTNNVHIEDSYKVISPVDMRIVLNDIIEFLNTNHITMDTPLNHRSDRSLCNEWITHNNAYKLGFRKDQSEDVDLNYPQAWYAPIVYWFGSLIAL